MTAEFCRHLLIGAARTYFTTVLFTQTLRNDVRQRNSFSIRRTQAVPRLKTSSFLSALI